MPAAAHATRPLRALMLAAGVAGVWVGVPAACSRTLDAYPEEFAGVGIVLQATGAAIVVAQVVPEGPAAEAGLRQGGVVRAIDGKPVEGRPLADVVGRLRGRVGTEVALTVEGPGAAARETFALKRRVLARHDGGYASP